MATVRLSVERVCEFLDRRMPEIRAERKAFMLSVIERTIAPHRGKRHFWFGKLKTDEDLKSEATMRGAINYGPFPETMRTIFDLRRTCIMSEDGWVSVTDKECAVLAAFGYEGPERSWSKIPQSLLRPLKEELSSFVGRREA